MDVAGREIASLSGLSTVLQFTATESMANLPANSAYHQTVRSGYWAAVRELWSGASAQPAEAERIAAAYAARSCPVFEGLRDGDRYDPPGSDPPLNSWQPPLCPVKCGPPIIPVSRLRDEFSNQEVFDSVRDARRLGMVLREDYNHGRTHGALRYRTSAALGVACGAAGSATFRPPQPTRIPKETLISLDT